MWGKNFGEVRDLGVALRGECTKAFDNNKRAIWKFEFIASQVR